MNADLNDQAILRTANHTIWNSGSVATRLLHGYGYLVPNLNPDSSVSGASSALSTTKTRSSDRRYERGADDEKRRRGQAHNQKLKRASNRWRGLCGTSDNAEVFSPQPTATITIERPESPNLARGRTCGFRSYGVFVAERNKLGSSSSLGGACDQSGDASAPGI